MAKVRARHILDQQRKNVRTLKHKLNLVGILLPWRKTIQRALQENKVETLGSLGPVKWLRNLIQWCLVVRLEKSTVPCRHNLGTISSKLPAVYSLSRIHSLTCRLIVRSCRYVDIL